MLRGRESASVVASFPWIGHNAAAGANGLVSLQREASSVQIVVGVVSHSCTQTLSFLLTRSTTLGFDGCRPLPGSGAVFRGYNFANTWEQNAPLTEEQTVAVAALSLAASERPFPSNLSQEHDTRKDGIAVVSSSDSVGESGIAGVLVNTHQFYKWFTDLESAMKSETEEKYRLYVNTLLERIQICDGILEEVDDTLNLFNELQALQLSVATKTKTLHDACDRLLLEKQRLIDFAEALEQAELF
ncbi:hypothetical protein HPP92_012428 [Vanilla planifolia]|uniref:Conserved oligomeric Golgi complex subunit 3 N-terminal domain-containing protein n=1 Tax=Vanilla planifolia TaxID=51239 RepID=A0A835QS37_VANPL|nr:hypothetical protein HPP92_012428 [Vanilla planifolia]